MAIADLLAASRAAHLQKKHAAGRVDSKGVVASKPDYPKAEAHMAEALRLRLEAHALDPEHTDPAWTLDTVPHDDIVAFMRHYPTIP